MRENEEEIEKIRYKLNDLVKTGENLCSSKIIYLSEELDKAIVEYYEFDMRNSRTPY
jgi:DNA polymerase III delta prime subunit